MLTTRAVLAMHHHGTCAPIRSMSRLGFPMLVVFCRTIGVCLGAAGAASAEAGDTCTSRRSVAVLFVSFPGATTRVQCKCNQSSLNELVCLHQCKTDGRSCHVKLFDQKMLPLLSASREQFDLVIAWRLSFVRAYKAMLFMYIAAWGAFPQDQQ